MTDSTRPTAEKRGVPVIDFHAHVVEPDVYDATVNHNVISGFGERPLTRPREGGPSWGVFSRMTDPALQIRDMDRRGIDVSVISTSLVSQDTGWANAPVAAGLDRRANEQIAAWVGRHPDRFVGSFTLPMQDLKLALRELEYAVSTLGLKVINVSSNTRGTYLGDPQFRPFWEAAHALRLPVFIHPHGASDRFYLKYALWNSVGQPVEETLVMASLIYEGVFESFPDLTVVIAHGGGYLPHYTGRLDRAASYHPVSAKHLRRPPSQYLKCFYYDSCVYDVTVLEALIARVGPDRVVLGSDYPFGEDDPVGFLRRCSNASDADVELMASGTPAGLLALKR